jgi:hypothetical protein
MAEKQENGIFDGLKETFSVERAKKVAAAYIDTSEELANDALDLHEKATAWAKDTLLGRMFEAQTKLGRRMVQGSAKAARDLWRISPAAEPLNRVD